MVGTNGDFPGLDPAAVAVDVTNSGIGSAIYEELVDGSIGAAPKPGLASAYTEAPDRKSWTLTIRDGVTFHDGTKLDATAVKLNLERQRKSPVNALSMALIKSIDVVDPLTVRLILDKPYSAMPYLLAGNAGIMISPKAIAEHSDILNRAPTDAGTGPYVLKDWVPGDHLTVVRNPNYWGAPKPRLDQIMFRPILDEGARYAALQAGDVQSIVTNLPATTARARKDGFNVVDPPTAGYLVIYFNNTKPPLNDVRIRRAAALAINQQLLSTTFDIPSENAGFSLWPSGDPWYSAAGDIPTFDKNAAHRLVNDSIRDTGLDASFTLLLANGGATSVDYARLVAKFWQDAGIDVKVNLVAEPTQVIGAVATGQYEAAVFLVGLAKDPDPTAYPVLSSASPLNFSRYKNPEMDAALETGRTSGDPVVRKAAYAKVQELFRRDVPFIIGQPGSSHVISTKAVCGITGATVFTSQTAGLGTC